MKFTLNFIKQFLLVDMPASQLAHVLTMAGMEVESVVAVGDDWVFDIEVTTNRYDWLSVIGIARDVAACLSREPDITYPQVVKKPLLKGRKIIIEDAHDCPYYVGRLLRGCTIAPSDARVASLVGASGITVINNVVDSTNYCMLKWGNPLHAFDADTIEGDVYIRRGRTGEVFTGIDGKERELSSENLVIADDVKIIALAGVMGSSHTQVTQATKNVFLEAAIFSPVTVRRSRRRAGLDTDASYRFERQVCAQNLMYASQEAADMILQSAGAACAGYGEAGKKPAERSKKITVRLDALNAYIGKEFDSAGVKRVLTHLGFAIKKSSAGTLEVVPPGFRFDVQCEVDVYEEVSRMHGYDAIVPVLPLIKPQLKIDDSYDVSNALREHCVRLGLHETVTFSLTSSAAFETLGYTDPLMLVNPLRTQENALRPALVSGMLDVMRYNMHRGRDNVKLFEIADVYTKIQTGFTEEPMLAIGVSFPDCDFRYIKGIVERVLFFCTVPFSYTQGAVPYARDAVIISSGDERIGYIARVTDAAARAFDIRTDVYIAQLDVRALARSRHNKTCVPLNPFPAITRDISIMLSAQRIFSDIEAVIAQVCTCAVSWQIVDTYRGKNIPADCSAYTLRIVYQAHDRTLAGEEVDTVQGALRQRLASLEGVTLR